MDRLTSIQKSQSLQVTNNFTSDFKAKAEKPSSLFSNSYNTPVGDDLRLSSPVAPPPDRNDTIPVVQQPDTLRMFKNPKDMVVVEFYPSGKPHYVKDFYDNVMIKKTEYTGDGIAVAVDEYTDGVLRRHTENYPGSGEPWIIEEYSEKGKLLRLYEYAPFYELIDYKTFPDEE